MFTQTTNVVIAQCMHKHPNTKRILKHPIHIVSSIWFVENLGGFLSATEYKSLIKQKKLKVEVATVPVSVVDTAAN